MFSGEFALTELLVAALEPVGLHLAVEVLLALLFLFKLRVFVVPILELRLFERLVPFDVFSEC
jgi:small basic protein